MAMETRCPQCHTVFRVAEEQLAIADGKVRCGECSHVFNARDNVIDVGDRQIETINIEVPDIKVKDISLDDNEDQQQAEDEQATAPDAPEQAQAPVELSEDADVDQPPEETPPPEGKDKAGYDVTELYPELRKAPAFQPPPSARATFVWSVAILLLLGLLFVQLVYFNRDRLAAKPKLRPLLESMCETMDCELAGRRAPALIRLQSHKVLSHPKEKQALRVEAIIINEADFVQAYPLLRLRFRNLDGKLLATREFLPKHYLPTDVDRQAGMTPGEPVNTVLDIIDPGKKAISYEFDFL
jgi:predicted Zn finger-like uncharacterized protein